MTKWALNNTDVTYRRGECACACACDETHPSFKHVLRSSVFIVFIQLCDSSDGSRVPTRLQRYVVSWAQQAELLFIIHWWLFIAERQHHTCSVCPVFACRASLAALFSQKLNCVCGREQWRAGGTGTGWVPVLLAKTSPWPLCLLLVTLFDLSRYLGVSAVIISAVNEILERF